MFFAFRMLRRAISAIVIAVVVTLGATAGWVTVNALREDTSRTDGIVVLGAAQFNGTPSPVLRNRLDRAYTLYSAHVADFIVTVGGSRPGDVYTEATSGRIYLHRRGIPESHLKGIRTGSDTYNSLIAVATWAHGRGWKTITVVTDRCHEARASAMLSSLGFSVRQAPPTTGAGSAITWAYVVRETGGLLRFWLLNERGSAASA